VAAVVVEKVSVVAAGNKQIINLQGFFLFRENPFSFYNAQVENKKVSPVKEKPFLLSALQEKLFLKKII
jgi:hypothetical protein